MATLDDAQAARVAHQDRLGALGAHAIEIQPIVDGGGYELIVHFASAPPASVPRSLVIRTGGKTATVPVRTVTRAT